MSEHNVIYLESAKLYSGRERRPGEKRFKIPRYVKFLKDSVTKYSFFETMLLHDIITDHHCVHDDDYVNL